MQTKNQYHELSVSSAPAVEPVSVADAKTFMRISFATDDSYIGNLITVAIKQVEEHLNRSLITQTLICYYTRYSARVYLPNAPIQSVSTVTQIAADNTNTNLTANADYYLKGINDKYLEFAGSYYLPQGHSAREGNTDAELKVTYVAGYGDAATDVPEPIIEAIKRLVLYYYDNRDEVVIGAAVSNMPSGISNLLYPYINIML